MRPLQKAKTSRVAPPDQAYKEPLPDLVLMDLMLSDMSGTEVCRELRTNELTRHIPIIMLTAKEEEIGRVVGFAVGADDYVVKPFSVSELILRIRAVLRRFQPKGGESTQTTYGILRLDTEAHRVWVGGEEITLTALEFKLLAFLAAHRGRVQSREQLLSDVWGINGEIRTRTVDTHVKQLRHKLGEAAGYVETLRGVGYRFSDEGPLQQMTDPPQTVPTVRSAPVVRADR